MKNTFKIVQYERKVYEPRGEGSRSVAEVIEHLRRFVKKYILKNENITWDTHQSVLALFPDVKVKKETLDCYASSVFKKIKSVYKYSELNDAQKQYVNTKIAKYFVFMRNKCRDIIYNPDIKSETKELAKFFYNENNTKCFGSVLNFPNDDCIYIVNNTPVISLIGWKFADTLDTDKELYKYVTTDFNDVDLSLDAIDPTERFYSQYHYFNESETPYSEPNPNEIYKLTQNNMSDVGGNSDSISGVLSSGNSNNGEQINRVWPKVESEHWETDEADSRSTDTSFTSNTDNNSEAESIEDDFDKDSVNKDSADYSYDDIDELNELSGDSSKEIFDDLANNKSSDDKDGEEQNADAEFPNENDSKNLDNIANNQEAGSSEENEITELEEVSNNHKLCKLILGTILVFLLILLIILLIGYFFPNLRPEFVDEWISDEQSVVDNNRTQMMNNPSAGGVGGIDGGVGDISGGVGGIASGSGLDSGISGGSSSSAGSVAMEGGSSAGSMSMDDGSATSGGDGSSLGGDSTGNSLNSMNGDGNAPINATNTDDNNQQSASKSEDSQFDSSTSEDTKDANNGVSLENLNEPEGKVPDYQKRVATANMENMKLSYIFQNDASSVRVIMSDSNKEVCSINSNLQTIDDKKVLTTNKEETKDKCGFEITKIECNSNFANCYLVFDSMGWRVAVGSSGITNMPKKDTENNSQKNLK